MSGTSLERTQNVLAKHLPFSLVNNFMKGRERGFLHARSVEKVQQELLKYGTVDLIGKENEALQWATTLHDIAYIQDKAQYMQVFADHKISKESVFPLLAGLNNLSVSRVLKMAGDFNTALKTKNAPLFPFHHLTGALFAFNVLTKEKELSNVDAVIAAQAILFHHENNLIMLPPIPAVRLLRDSVKLESLNEGNLADIIDLNVLELDRPFFNPRIPLGLRQDIIEGHKDPEEQDSVYPDLTIDAFQFALKALLPDINPNMFIMHSMARPYINNNALFIKFLKVTIDSAKKYNESLDLYINNMGSLRGLLQLAMNSSFYSGNLESIKMGGSYVNGYLEQVIKEIDGYIKKYPSKEYTSLAVLLSLKSQAFGALGNDKEKKFFENQATLRVGIEAIMEKDPEAGN